MTLDAVGGIVGEVRKGWGDYGYSIESLRPVGGGAVAEVWSSDGGVFYVGADRWGQTCYADSAELVMAALAAMRVSVTR